MATCPAFEIPSRYFHYVRTGDARPLAAVFEHNRLDLLALALITGARLAAARRGRRRGADRARSCWGSGRLYERAGMIAQACACYLRADELPGDVTSKAPRRCARTPCCRAARAATRMPRAHGAACSGCAAVRRASRARRRRRSRCTTSIARATSARRARFALRVAAIQHQRVAAARRAASPRASRAQARTGDGGARCSR